MIIVVGVDSSDMGPTVVDHAIAHARCWEAELHAVHVFEPPAALYGMEAGFAVAAGDMGEAERAAVWEGIAPILESSGVPWLRVDLEGHPPSLLIHHAQEVDADLIVVGTRGRGELAALVLGSTSHGVIHSSPCDVLVVRKRPDNGQLPTPNG